MAEVELHFTEQFDGESVVVSHGGRQVFKAEHLRTDTRTSSALIVRISVPDGPTELTFAVAPQGVRTALPIDPQGLKFLEVSLGDRKLEVKAVTVADYAREPRGYA